MKKTEIYPNNEVIYALSPEPIDENEPICLVDYMLPQNGERSLDYSRMRCFGEDDFKLKIGGTTYEISTHFNPNGRQCVMEQFKELILSENLI